MKAFKPMKFPNDAYDVDKIEGTYLMSPKLDGIRCIFIDGQMCSRHPEEVTKDRPVVKPGQLKLIPNVTLQERFNNLKGFTKDTGLVLDGELYGPGMSFQDITHFVMSHNCSVPGDLEFWCFDVFSPQQPELRASSRFELSCKLQGMSGLKLVPQTVVNRPDQIKRYYAKFREQGYEGAILKRIDSPYKFGRVTVKSGMGYKIKPYLTFDARVIGIVQATQAKEGGRTKDAFGKSCTSKKKGDRVPINKACAFLVDHAGVPTKVTLAMKDPEKKYIWNHSDEFIGRMIEFKGMLVGAKNKVRHPVFVRFRDDKEELE